MWNKFASGLIFINSVSLGGLSSCNHFRTSSPTMPSERLAKNRIYPSEEELIAVKLIEGVSYGKILNRAFAGDYNAIKELINIRTDERAFWDAAAGENFTDNFHQVILNAGDGKIARAFKSEQLAGVKRKQWLDILYPYDYAMKRVKAEDFPLTYKILSS
jgi:hypothetical protein